MQPYRPWHRLRFFSLALAVLCPLATRAQSTTDTIYHLHGTVRNGVTNKPVGRALVTSVDRRLATMTDSEGHFNIDLSVPASAAGPAPGQAVVQVGRFGGGLSLTAQRPGYLSPEQQPSLTIDDSLNTTEQVIRLMPAAVVAGRVTASGVDSPQGVRVSLLRHSVLDGAYSWVQVGSHNVGSTGEFRFTNLQPGEYTVMTAEWAGGEPLATQRSEITQQYPPDFLGDTRTLTSAAKVRLHYGSEEHAELHLHAARYLPVVIPVQNQPANSPINVRVAGADAMNGYQLGWNARDGAVEGSLPSGSYTLLLTSFGPQQGSAMVPLTVGAQPLQHAPVTLAAGNSIPIHVHAELTQSSSVSSGPPVTNSNLVQVYLRPLDSDGSYGGSSVRHGDDTEPALENVQPGLYMVRTNAARGYVSSMTSGSIDLLRSPLRVGDGGTADPIDVTVRDDIATLTGTVDYGSTAAQNATLTLVPLDGSANALSGFARADGKFSIGNVPPGSYRLFATPPSRMMQLPFRDPQAMRAYAGKGAAVSLKPGESGTVNVSLSDAADMDKD